MANGRYLAIINSGKFLMINLMFPKTLIMPITPLITDSDGKLTDGYQRTEFKGSSDLSGIMYLKIPVNTEKLLCTRCDHRIKSSKSEFIHNVFVS